MEKRFDGSEKIGDIVSEFAGASKLFKEFNIDFCCGGNRPLQTVLLQKNIDGEQFMESLNQAYFEAKKEMDPGKDWRQASLSDLIDHVVFKHHAYLQKELSPLSEFVTKILRVHGASHGETLLGLHRLYHLMKLELEQHLMMEEEIVFPLIKQYELQPSAELFQRVAQTIRELEGDHDHVGGYLKEMRVITRQYQLPEDACRTYALTFRKLEEMESDIFEHIHLENNILFPRVSEIA